MLGLRSWTNPIAVEERKLKEKTNEISMAEPIDDGAFEEEVTKSSFP